MFNTTNVRLGNNINTTNNNIEFNSVSGTLVKSCAESQFIRFHMESKRAETFFSEEPYFSKKVTHYFDKSIGGGSCIKEVKIPVSVLQVMLAGGDQFLVEYILMKESDDV